MKTRNRGRYRGHAFRGYAGDLWWQRFETHPEVMEAECPELIDQFVRRMQLGGERIFLDAISFTRENIIEAILGVQRVNPHSSYVDPSHPGEPRPEPKPLTKREAIRRRIRYRESHHGKSMLSFKPHDDRTEFFTWITPTMQLQCKIMGRMRPEDNLRPVPPHPWPGEVSP